MNPVPTSHATSTEHPLESPFAAMGNAWKMPLYLVPMLLVIVGGLHLLRSYQQRTGRMPASLRAASRSTGARTASRGILGALLGGFQLNNARQRAGSNIRVLESVPIGGANVHLIEVRGRLLLLGAAGANIALLTELEEQIDAGDSGFSALLHAAAADLNALDLDDADLPATATVTTLEEMMHETSETVSRRARRLRTVQEAEEAYQEG